MTCTLGTKGLWAETSRRAEAARCGGPCGLGGSRAAPGGAGKATREKPSAEQGWRGGWGLSSAWGPRGPQAGQ